MAEIRLDYQDVRAFPWRGAALLAFVLAAMAPGTGAYLVLQDKVDRQEAKVERIRASQARAVPAEQPNKRDAALLAQEIKQANEVLRRLTMPWDRLFQAVESPEDKEVTLLALAPNTEKRTVKISGEAKDMQAVLRYITQLETRPEFGSVYLNSHQVQEQDPEKPVRFTLLAEWRENL